jgi:hypothetical protein
MLHEQRALALASMRMRAAYRTGHWGTRDPECLAQ